MAVSGGNASSDDAFSLVAGNPQIVGFLGAIADETDKEKVIEEAENIINSPPEEKFTGSANLFSSVIDTDKKLSELNSEDLPPWVKGLFGQDNAQELVIQVLSLLSEEIQRLRKQLHEEILDRPRHPESYLVLSLLLDEYSELLDYLSDNIEREEMDGDVEAIGSIYSVIASHLLLISTGERENIYPELIKDVFRYRFYYPRALGKEEKFDPEELSLEEMDRAVLVESVVQFYQEETISVSRGAELLGTDRTTFEDLLVKRGIRPKYGPETAEELYDDVELSK